MIEKTGKLLATSDSNWDYYVVEDNREIPYCYSIAKPSTGASNSGFGNLNHICRLIEEDRFDGDFTEYGRSLMVKYGHEKLLKKYEAIKNYEIKFYDTSRLYGRVLRTEIAKVNTRGKAYTHAYNIINREVEHDISVELLKEEA